MQTRYNTEEFTLRYNGQLAYMGNTVLKKYIRDKNNQRVGMVCAFPVDGKIRFSFCVANTKKGDQFDRDLAENICLGRALKHPELQMPFDKANNLTVPKNAQDALWAMYFRAKSYFKYLTDNGLTYEEV